MIRLKQNEKIINRSNIFQKKKNSLNFKHFSKNFNNTSLIIVKFVYLENKIFIPAVLQAENISIYFLYLQSHLPITKADPSEIIVGFTLFLYGGNRSFSRFVKGKEKNEEQIKALLV